MGAQFFDNLSTEQTEEHQKPFWAVDLNDEDELLRWLKAELDARIAQGQDRQHEQKKNLAVYRGIQYRASDTRSRDEAVNESAITKRSRNPRVIYNHMVDMVEQDVSRMTKYRGAVAATPPSDDNSDRVVAGIAEDLIESFWDKVDIDSLTPKHRRRVRIMGENFIGCFWNRNLGPYDQDWVAEVLKRDPKTMKPQELRKALREALAKGTRLPLIDPETGKQMEGRDGKPLWIDRPLRQGDVAYKLINSWDMFLQRVPDGDYEKVENGMFKERLPVETLRAMHPAKADKIQAEGGYYFDLDTCEEIERSGDVDAWHFYHKSTDLLDGGRYVKFTRTAILINRPNPYLGWDDRAILPWVRTVDIDTPAVLNGDSTVTHGRGPMAVYNNLISLRTRNRFLFSHPKWFYPQGTVTKESLANNATMVAYKGPVAPQLVQPAINEANESQMLQEAKSDLQQIMGVYGVSRGDPPAGVTAAVALTFLDEQENDRANVGVQAQTSALEQLALQTLWLMADNYSVERLRDLLGKTRAAQLESFEMANLRSISDLRLQSTTALPQQKSARLQYILDVKKEFPGLIGNDQAIDLLGLGESDRLRTIATTAIRKSDDENESLMNGAETPAPEKWEFQIIHYRSHVRQMNEPAFEKLPDEDKERFKDHVMAHELFMWEIGLKNPGFAQAVQQEFPAFPLFYVPDPGILPGPTLPTPPPMGGEMPPTPDGVMPADPNAPVPPGADLAVPPPEALPPGAEAMIPGGAPA